MAFKSLTISLIIAMCFTSSVVLSAPPVIVFEDANDRFLDDADVNDENDIQYALNGLKNPQTRNTLLDNLNKIGFEERTPDLEASACSRYLDTVLVTLHSRSMKNNDIKVLMRSVIDAFDGDNLSDFESDDDEDEFYEASKEFPRFVEEIEQCFD